MSREGRINSLLPGKYLAMSIMIIYIYCYLIQGLLDQFKNMTNVAYCTHCDTLDS